MAAKFGINRIKYTDQEEFNVKKHLALLMAVLVAATAFVGCGKKEEAAAPADNTATEAPATDAKWADGKYFAMGDSFDAESGWKSTVLIEVKDGKIVSADWNGISNKMGIDKDTASKTGKYPMVEVGGAKAPWHEQAAAAEAFLVEKQDPAAITINGEGKTDAIASVTIAVADLPTLAEKALAAGPAQAGPYKDGAYHAEGKDFDAQTGWKGTVDVTVMNGNIVSAIWSGVNKNNEDKLAASMEGKYPMVEQGGAKAPWHEQANATVAFFLEKQDPAAITVKGDGKTDAIASVTIAVGEFTELVTQALSTAK